MFKVRLSEFTAKRLDKLFKSSSLSKMDLIVEDLESVFALRLDRNVTYLTDAQFVAVMDNLGKPLSKRARRGAVDLNPTLTVSQ